MAEEFRLQDPGEGIHEAEIREVHVSPGDAVEEGETVLTVETDKAAMDLPAPFTGTVEEIRVEADQVVEVGDVLMTWTPEGGDGATGDAQPGAEAADQDEGAEGEGTEKDESDGPRDDEAAPDREGSAETGERDRAAAGGAPAGGGVAGRPAGEETADGADTPDEGEPRPEGPDDREAPAEHPRDRPVPAAPATRRLARELGVDDLHRVPGTGPEGRVTAGDVRAFAQDGAGVGAEDGERAAPEDASEPAREAGAETRDGETAAPRRRSAPLAPPAPGTSPELPDFERWGPVERVPLRSVRRATARRMAESWARIPHVTHQDVADVTELERFLDRAVEGAGEEDSPRITLTVLVVKAVAAALREHPRFNASLDVEAAEIVLKEYVHVGVAVDTDRGLLVPVVRDADRRSVREIAREMERLTERVRSGEVEREELRGGTFTVTNPGPIGGRFFTPLIHPPQAAILGMGRAFLEPVARGTPDDPELGARRVLPLSLAFDHRLVDGADAARFVNTVRRTLADPGSFLLSV